MAENHTYKFNVSMSCGGCSGAVDRVLKKLDGPPNYDGQAADPGRHLGVESYDVSLEKQEATVIAQPQLDYETVLKTIKKTGKTVNSGEADGVSKSIDLPTEVPA
ncbi:putative Metal homeostasis factor atx1 [Seiridium cardinale]|uniref:Metal homeostasis factor atx1 n=1 Tax=Seiridium cardinale TaxID=138064 RepID=A0ABR2Y0D4_9PEZI